MGEPKRIWTWKHLAAVSAGVFLILGFLGLDETQASLHYRFVRAFTFSDPGEPYFWLAHALLLVPGAALIGWGIAPWGAPGIAALWASVEKLERREVVMGLVCLGLLGASLARIMRAVFLFDYPVTDDETAVRFGGQILAGGSFTVPEPPLYEEMPNLFAFRHDGVIGSMDWLGGQLAMAAAELGLGPWAHALLAAVPLVAITMIVGRRYGRTWGLIGAVFFLMSPMAFALSMTSHAQLVSRAFLSLALLGFCLGLEGERPGAWVLAGFGLGMSFLSRPFETATLAAPIALCLVYRAVRRPKERVAIALVVLGATGPMLAFFAHNAAVTGFPHVPPRYSGYAFSDSHIAGGGVITSDPSLLWNRFGANLSYNLFMLAVWFLGPLGVLLVGFGAFRGTFATQLSLGVCLSLLLALCHDNHGVHHIGPVHYSEAAVPLVIVAVHGLYHIREKVVSLGASFRTPGVVVATITVLGLGLFNLWHGLQLQRQATIHATIYGYLDRDEIPRSVVLVPPYESLWLTFPEFAHTGSWVLNWRHNRPDLSDRVLLIHDGPDVALRAAEAFPDRQVLRLTRIDEGPGLALVPPDLGPRRPSTGPAR